MHDVPALAWVGGWQLSELVDVTADLSALDSAGCWAVVLPFEGPAVCARFARRVRLGAVPHLPWAGPRPGAWDSSLDRRRFTQAVAAVRRTIADGGVYQVNLTRRLSAPLPANSSVVALAATLARHHPAPHQALVHLPGAGLQVASASPESFLRRRGRWVESRPIKGTARHAAGLLPKDRAENVMIVDLVRNDLGRVCDTGSVRVPALCATEEHPGLVHLVSTVRGRLRAGVGWAELVDATFPPGSVTGAPKLAALRVIADLEPVARGPYCGAIGWVDADSGDGELNVAIRTFWFSEGRLCFGTGGAITWDSDPSGEWAETELKAERLLRVAARQPEFVA